MSDIKLTVKAMTQEEAAKWLRQVAEATAKLSHDWDNFEQIALSTIKGAMDAAREFGREEAEAGKTP